MTETNPSEDLWRCPLALNLFRDPVLVQDGHTYERQAIKWWLQRNGASPLTRQPLSTEHIYSNLVVKQIVDNFEALMSQKNYPLH